MWIKAVHKRGELNSPQDFWCYPSQLLLGCSQSHRVRNNVAYTVVAVTADKVKVQGDGEFELSHEQAGAMPRLSHTVTYASCQGTEFDGTVKLWDLEHPRLTRKHLYVAISRPGARA